MVGREDYFGGREHAAIKHHFLKQYLPSLAFKTLQARGQTIPSFCYIDGFTGPWKSRDEQYKDTSFGVALEELNKVATKLPHKILRAVFCESRSSAFEELNKFVAANQANVNALCIHGNFEDNIEEIIAFTDQKDFVFAFIDPKGWKVDASAIAPLLSHRRSEVLFNFMAEFIGRFPDFDGVNKSYAALLGNTDWKEKYEALHPSLSGEEKILTLFRDMLKEQWGFSHVLELPIKKPQRNRIFYKLVYGTRSPYGVLEFREAQSRAEKEGFAVANESLQGEQFNLWNADEIADQMVIEVGVGSGRHLSQMRDSIDRMLSETQQVTFLSLCARLMETIPVRKVDVSKEISQLYKLGKVSVTDLSRSRRPGLRSLLKKI